MFDSIFNCLYPFFSFLFIFLDTQNFCLSYVYEGKQKGKEMALQNETENTLVPDKPRCLNLSRAWRSESAPIKRRRHSFSTDPPVFENRLKINISFVKCTRHLFKFTAFCSKSSKIYIKNVHLKEIRSRVLSVSSTNFSQEIISCFSNKLQLLDYLVNACSIYRVFK